jgi:hypothetical protein
MVQEKTLASPKKVIRGVGLELNKSSISVFYFVLIVIEKFMLQAQLPRETVVETAGELLGAVT